MYWPQYAKKLSICSHCFAVPWKKSIDVSVVLEVYVCRSMLTTIAVYVWHHQDLSFFFTSWNPFGPRTRERLTGWACARPARRRSSRTWSPCSGPGPCFSFAEMSRPEAELSSSLQVPILGLQDPILRSWVMYKGSVVKIYNATSSLVRLENKNLQ
jgi:hypothetical protein